MPTAPVLACVPFTIQSFIHWRHSNENMKFGLRWETFAPAPRRRSTKAS